MGNPLFDKRFDERVTFSGPVYGTQEWCDWRNTMMVRTDIEWVTDGKGGCYLRDRAEWTAQHTRDLAKAAEKDRRDWAWRQSHPVSEAA